MTAAMGKTTTTLSAFVHGLNLDDIPGDVVTHTKRLVANFIAASLWGWHSTGGQQAHTVLSEIGGTPEASVYGTARQLPATSAGAVHAALAFATKSDDTHGPAQLHPGHAIIAPVLALGEVRRLSGRDCLTAVVAAMEAGIRIAHAVGPAQDVRHNSMRMGFWSEAKCGIAAALAAARAGGLAPELTPHAIGIAATSSSGLLSSAGYGPPPHVVPAGSVFAWDAGKAVLLGMLATRLAAAGMTAGAEPLEGPRGWVRVYTGGHGRLESLTEGLGTVFETGNVALKTHCMSHTIFPVIDAAGDLVTEHRLHPNDIAEVVIRAPAYVGDNFWRTAVSTYDDAVCSAPFAIGLNIVAPARLTYPDKVHRHLDDPHLGALMERFTFTEDPDIPMDSGQLTGTVLVRTLGGQTLERRGAPAARGSYPDYPLDEADIEHKLRAAAAYRLPPSQVDAVVEMVATLDDLPDVSELARALRTQP